MEFLSESFRQFCDIADQTLPVIRQSLDVDAIHDFRVALRQLRTIIRCAGFLLDQEFAAHLKAELAWVDNSFARMRNSQVRFARFKAYPDELRKVCLIDFESLGGSLLQETIEFNVFLGSMRFSRILNELRDADLSQLMAEDGSVKIRKELSSCNKKVWKSLVKRVEVNNHAELHQLRIIAKRVHYLSLASEPIVGKSTSKHREAAVKIQKRLGEYQDSAMMSEALHSVAALRYEAQSQVQILKTWDTFIAKREWRR